MKILNLAVLLLIPSLTPLLAAEKNITLTCPNSGKGTPQIQLTLTAAGGFELPKDQTMLLPITFEQATMESEDSQKRVKLNCVYNNSVTGKETVKKTVTLVAYTASGATGCKVVNSHEEGKPNRLVCKGES